MRVGASIVVVIVPVLAAAGLASACAGPSAEPVRQAGPDEAAIGDGPTPASPSGPRDLSPPEAFGNIADMPARSRALFVEAGKVIQHPRCSNCHPADDSPRQLNGELHEPPVLRGPDGHGIAALGCATCHQDRNAVLARVPGAPKWALAPIEMAWQGRSLGAICRQMKDPKRNGGKTLAQIVDHMAHDELVAWGWNPGADREPAPGTQAQLGALMAAWLESGAVCPDDAREEGRP